MTEWLIFLATVPLSCMYLTKSMEIKNRIMWNGIAIGAVIAPVSFGLIQMTYIPFLGKFLGLIGVIVNLTHGSIGYISLLWSGMIEPNQPITALEFVMINTFNGVLFAYIYGLIGYAVDRRMAKEKDRIPALKAMFHTVTPLS